MFKIFLLALILIAFAFVALAIGMLVSKKRKFPDSSISKNSEMQKRGITCAKHDEINACGGSGGCCGGFSNEHHS